MAKKNINEMSFLDHLEDLRWLFVMKHNSYYAMAPIS
jgi:hypothetical protein